MSIISSAASVLDRIHESLGGDAIPEEMDEIYQRIQLNDLRHQRIANGLLYRRDVRAVPSETLTKRGLEQLAKDTNAAFIHISGNCTLLSCGLLSNLMNENNALSVQNTYPIYKGVSAEAAETIVFGKELTCVGEEMSNLDEVEAAVLRNYHDHNERFYVLSSQGYQVPLIGASGHRLNAVILFREDGEPYVQFVDAWKTSDPTPTKETLSDRYQEATFSLYTSR